MEINAKSNSDNGTNVPMDAQFKSTPQGTDGSSEANAAEACGLGRDSQTNRRGSCGSWASKSEQEELIRETAKHDETWLSSDFIHPLLVTNCLRARNQKYLC